MFNSCYPEYGKESWGLILWWSKPGLWGHISCHQVVSTWGSMMRSPPMFIFQRIEVWGLLPVVFFTLLAWRWAEDKWVCECLCWALGLNWRPSPHRASIQYPDTSIQHLPASLTNKLTLPSIGDVFLACWRQSPSYGSKCSAGRGLAVLSLCKKKHCWWILVFRPNPAQDCCCLSPRLPLSLPCRIWYKFCPGILWAPGVLLVCRVRNHLLLKHKDVLCMQQG